MFRTEIRRVLGKLLMLALLITALAALSVQPGVRKVAAMSACCDNCTQGWVDCVNWCSQSGGGQACIYGYCAPRYQNCKNSCSPPC
jgi:hypothetical protein